MPRVVWRPLRLAIIILSISIDIKQAANVGGSGQNEVKAETTTPAPEVTTSRGLLVSAGAVNFTVQSGTKVTLHCRVEHRDENTSVSWLRRRGYDLELISVNMDVFKDDPRYTINYIHPADWQLYIRPVNYTDQGFYECQVNSHPPLVHTLYLHVVDDLDKRERRSATMDYPLLTTLGIDDDDKPFEIRAPTTDLPLTTTIDNNPEEPSITHSTTTDLPFTTTIDLVIYLDCSKDKNCPETTTPGRDKAGELKPQTETPVPKLEIRDERNIAIKNKFYNSGSTIELRCLILKVPTPTQFIIWKHNSTILNYDTTRGGISVKTDILPDGGKSQLYIANVGPTDSGNYSCSLGEETVTSVSVVVITGETPAAMQHGSATAVNVGLLTILSAALAALS